MDIIRGTGLMMKWGVAGPVRALNYALKTRQQPAAVEPAGAPQPIGPRDEGQRLPPGLASDPASVLAAR